MAVKEIFITDSNEGPNVNDDWVTSIPLDATKDYTNEELVDIVETQHPSYVDHAIWYYEGEDYEDKDNVLGKNMKLVNGDVRYGLIFNPWDTTNVVLIQKVDMIVDPDSVDQTWQQEIAMEAGMLHGVNAYNDAMGY